MEKVGKHAPAGPLRGGKYSTFEGGTRVPFIVRWPGRVKRGVSDALISHVDLLASFATLTGQSLAGADAPDSRPVLPALLGRSKTGRRELVEQGNGLALRLGQWKYIEPNKGLRISAQTNIELGNDLEPQLYDLSADIRERTNVATKNPKKLRQMEELLQRLKRAGKAP